jgi:hypothetical protein
MLQLNPAQCHTAQSGSIHHGSIWLNLLDLGQLQPNRSYDYESCITAIAMAKPPPTAITVATAATTIIAMNTAAAMTIPTATITPTATATQITLPQPLNSAAAIDQTPHTHTMPSPTST